MSEQHPVVDYAYVHTWFKRRRDQLNREISEMECRLIVARRERSALEVALDGVEVLTAHDKDA